MLSEVSWDTAKNQYPTSPRSSTSAVFAGSFNPPHLGHFEIIRYLSSTFSEVHVVIGINPAKTYPVSQGLYLQLQVVKWKDLNLMGIVASVLGKKMARLKGTWKQLELQLGDFISNRHHTHMNSTIWVTLSNFVQYLGRTNQCTIDKTPKGWYIQFVDNSPEARIRAAAAKAKEEGEVSAEQRHDIQLKKAIAECKKEGGFQESEFTELQRKEGDAPISFNMAAGAASSSLVPVKAPTKEVTEADGKKNALAQAFEKHETGREVQDTKKHKLSAVERIRLEHEESKRRKVEPAPASPSESSSSGSEPWLTEGIIVKVMHQDLAGGKYYRKKGKVEKVRKQFTADIRMVESRDLIRLDQEMLETVIPNLGKPVLVVKGQYKGKKGQMRTVDLEGFCVAVELEDGRDVEGLRYDEVCKIEEG
ncbi:Kin [Symbiodinium pilosum]|uniref:Phosphopantetheine adenylyltransferase n=1 Tax=Symbiodinium pilosum TaxID=2952 RepID=A0A812PJL4_SYMPI|nr:Kin [Symbiodinium pilosum]